MPAEDALRALGLEPGASADEIKQAYRDMVKVWHPDRFGSDTRLRAKAEERLKEINEAYRTLEAANFGPGKATEERPAEPVNQPPVSYAYSPAHAHGRTQRFGLYAASALLLAAIVAFVVHQVTVTVGANPQPQPAVQSTSAPVQKPAHPHRPASEGLKTGASGFQVWDLPQADSDRLQLACSAHPAGSEGYRNCIAAQLRAIQRSSAPPQMTGLDTGEQEAAEMACAAARNSGGLSAYNHCLRQQVAAVAAEPVRPDLSGFSATDRASMQAACSGARQRGAADYDRCIARFARTMSDAQRSAR